MLYFRVCFTLVFDLMCHSSWISPRYIYVVNFWTSQKSDAKVLSSPLDCRCLLVRPLVREVAGLLEQLLGLALEQWAGVQQHLKFTRGEKARSEASDEIGTDAMMLCNQWTWWCFDDRCFKIVLG